jgi:integrase
MFQALYQKWEKESLSPSTIRLIHRIIRQAMEDAVKWKKLIYNPAQYVKLPKAREAEIPVLTMEEIDRFLTCAQEIELHALFRMALLLGMRRGELIGLKWSDIDFEADLLKIERSISYLKDPETGKYHFMVGPPKTRAGKRIIPLPRDIVEILHSHREQQLVIQATAPHWENLDLVFCTGGGNYINPKHVETVFGKLLKRAGLGHMKFHALRHNASGILRRLKIDAVVRMKILGHEKIEMTDGVYGHTTLEDLKEAMQELDQYFHRKKEE